MSSHSLYAGIYIITSKSSPINSISGSKLRNAYLGKLVIVGGNPIVPVELPSSSAVQQSFVKSVTNLNMSLLMQYRSRLIFAGKGRLPKRVSSQGAMMAYVARNPYAIGYVSQKPSSSNVKVIKTI